MVNRLIREKEEKTVHHRCYTLAFPIKIKLCSKDLSLQIQGDLLTVPLTHFQTYRT